jgi:hypothetical protein
VGQAALELQERSADLVLHGRSALLVADRCCVGMSVSGGNCFSAGEESSTRSSGASGAGSGGGGSGASTAAIAERHIGQLFWLFWWYCLFDNIRS